MPAVGRKRGTTEAMLIAGSRRTKLLALDHVPAPPGLLAALLVLAAAGNELPATLAKLHANDGVLVPLEAVDVFGVGQAPEADGLVVAAGDRALAVGR